MNFQQRILAYQLQRGAKAFPAVLLTGPRRSGKTTLLRHAFPKAGHVLLEDPDRVAIARADPRAFLDSLRTPVILDEIQNAPDLLRYIRSRIDADPRARGKWLLTGSQVAPLMRQVTESMAGRAAVFQLLPFSLEESPKVTPLLGGYPEVLARPGSADIWFRSYLQTYLERDVRAVSAIRDLSTYRRFMALLASRTGTLLNKTELAAPLGVSVPTITEWLSILEITGLLLVVPPFFESFGKRLVKTPKVFLMDSGLACHLLGIRDKAALTASPFRGAIFEGFVAAEIAKARQHRGLERNLYYFRDRAGLEVDFLVERGNQRLLLVEAKATRTPGPGDTRAIQNLLPSTPEGTEAVLIHEGGPLKPGPLAQGVRVAGPAALATLAI